MVRRGDRGCIVHQPTDCKVNPLLSMHGVAHTEFCSQQAALGSPVLSNFARGALAPVLARSVNKFLRIFSETSSSVRMLDLSSYAQLQHLHYLIII